MDKTGTARAAVEETITTLTQKVISACDGDNPNAAAQYAEALADTARALSNIAEAQRDDRAEDD